MKFEITEHDLCLDDKIKKEPSEEYAAREDIIPNSLNEFFDPPLNLKPLDRKPFETQELKLIFNIKTYPDSHNRKNAARFWLPLISLYQGFRLSEIAQLDVADIVQQNKIPCFYINDESDDKAVKNKASNRLVPIHPQLIQMDFLFFVEYRRKENKRKLFFDKASNQSGTYYRGVSSWFARYIDGLGIDDPSKVFHSFRHTFASKAIERRMPTEYQNALGGWTDKGVGQRIYGKKKNMTAMLQKLSKVSYPIHKELKELENSFKSSYVINFLNR